LERIIQSRIDKGSLVIPALPVTCEQCLNALKDEDCSQRKLVGLLERDPAIIAHIVHAANAAAYGSISVRNVDQSVTRLGIAKVKVLLVDHATRQLFHSPDKRIRANSQQVWEHSLAVAIMARDLGALVQLEDPDACYLAGLLHDVGKPIVAGMLLEAERQLGQDKPGWIDSAEWWNIVSKTHRSIGLALAVKWQLPSDVTAAITDCSEYDPGDRQSIANIVRFANAIAKSQGFVAGPAESDEVDAMVMIGQSMLGVDSEVVARLSASLQAQIGKP
jgi:putative nucleotidyltransferase with HDIG domain